MLASQKKTAAADVPNLQEGVTMHLLEYRLSEVALSTFSPPVQTQAGPRRRGLFK